MSNTVELYNAPLKRKIWLYMNTRVGLVALFAIIVGFFIWLPDNIVITITLRDSGPVEVTETQEIVDCEDMAMLPTGFITVEKYTARVLPDKKPKPSVVVSKPAATSASYSYLTLPLTRTTDLESINFITRFHKVAQAEHKKYGQPASVKLAQALLESGRGKSTLARNANNFFGVKCFKKGCAKGACIQHSDDSPTDRFVVYKNAWHSFRAHSKFLKKKRYKDCYKSEDWSEWCDCLKKKGYATDPAYPSKLKSIIRRYKLYEFDTPIILSK